MNYTLTDTQHQMLIDTLDAAISDDKPYIAECVAALDMLRTLTEVGGEPVAYEFRMRADWVTDWGLWLPCSKEHHEMYIRGPKLHDWHYETRAFYAAPQPPAAMSAVQGDSNV